MVTTLDETDKIQHIRTSPADNTAPAVDLPERKTGGPADRLDWLISLAPVYGNAAFKLLAVLVKHSNSGGTCWPSRDLLILETGLPERTVDRAISELKTGGAMDVTKGRRVSTYQLSGASNGWQSCHQWQPRVATSGRLRVATSGKQNPSSSEPSKEPWVTGDGNAVGVEPTGVTTGVFTKGFEEEGVTTWTGKGFAALGTATVVEAKPQRQCAAPPPAVIGADDISEWMERYCPNHHEESAARPFAVRMLRHYQSEWWDTPIGNRTGGWGAFMTVDLVANRYIKSADSWRKFREDLIDKICRAGLPAELPNGDLGREPVYCNRCSAETINYETSTVMRLADGSIEVDRCGVCLPGVTA